MELGGKKVPDAIFKTARRVSKNSQLALLQELVNLPAHKEEVVSSGGGTGLAGCVYVKRLSEVKQNNGRCDSLGSRKII